MGKIIKSSTEKALADLRGQQQKLARWEAEKAAAEAELASLQARSGEEVLDDETAAQRLTTAMHELRDRAEIAGRAIAAQQPRVKAAERAYLEAEADELEKPLIEARAAVTRHQARTNELLRLLREHEGPFVPEEELRDAIPSGVAWVGREFSDEVPKSRLLAMAVEEAERPVAILRAMAEGREPNITLNSGETPADVYPACVWGPGAVVPAPAYLRAVENARGRVESLQREEESLPERIADADVDHGVRVGGPVRTAGRRLEKRLEEIPEQRAAAERELAALTGEDAATPAAS